MTSSEQPLDLSAPTAGRALTLACGDCKALRKEVQEVKEHLKALIDQFTAFTGNVAVWQRRSADATSPSSSGDSPDHRNGRRLSSSPVSNGSRKRKSTQPRAVTAVVNGGMSPISERPTVLATTMAAAAAMSTSQQQYHNLLRSPGFGWSAMWSPWWPQVPPTHGSMPSQTSPGSVQPHCDINVHAPSSKRSTWSPSPPSSGGDASSVKSEIPVEAVDVAKRRRLSVAVGGEENVSTPVEASDRKLKNAPDDFVKELVEKHNLLADGAAEKKWQIPVPEAFECDPDFRPVSEEQILHSVKWGELDWQDAVTRLAKKLAEKRVFGPMLMARATVAGTNHSSYPNLPIDGILYIESVCRRVLFPEHKSRLDFADYFRPAVKCLAARCRRIRHSLKIPPLGQSSNGDDQLSGSIKHENGDDDVSD